MSLLPKSRKKRKVGDIFVLFFPGEKYCFGRVIKTGVVGGGVPGFNLIYIYKYIKKDKNDVPNDLGVQNLLLPPIVTNNQGWLRGYFETVKTADIYDGGILPIHCFEDNILYIPSKYFDEYGKELKKKYKICGRYVLTSFWSIYKQAGRELNLPVPILDPTDE